MRLDPDDARGWDDETEYDADALATRYVEAAGFGGNMQERVAREYRELLVDIAQQYEEFN